MTKHFGVTMDVMLFRAISHSAHYSEWYNETHCFSECYARSTPYIHFGVQSWVLSWL